MRRGEGMRTLKGWGWWQVQRGEIIPRDGQGESSTETVGTLNDGGM